MRPFRLIEEHLCSSVSCVHPVMHIQYGSAWPTCICSHTNENTPVDFDKYFCCKEHNSESTASRGKKRERDRNETTYEAREEGGGVDRDAPPSGVHFQLSSPLRLSSFIHPPPYSLSPRFGKGETPLPECGNVTGKQPGGMDTGNQWVNKTADWVNNLEERPSKGSYAVLKILLSASYNLCTPNLRKTWLKSTHMRL